LNIVKVLCGNNTSINQLHVLGCVSWAHISDDYKKKFDPKIHACIMMGYYEELKSYKLFDPIKQKNYYQTKHMV